MNNRNISPLYLYTKAAIDSGNVNVRFLDLALLAVNNAIENCCIHTHKVSKNAFLNTFYILLRSMNKKVSLHKYQAVAALLTAKIECCVLQNA